MYKTVFQNSKAALAFAGMTILGAVSMVGTSENGGVLDATIDQLEQQSQAAAAPAPAPAPVEAPSAGDTASNTVSDPAAGWGSSTSVFGEYDPAQAASEPVPAAVVAASPSTWEQDEPLEADAPASEPAITDR